MKKLKYLVFIFVLMLFMIPKVNAESGKINIDSTGIQTSAGARFYNRTATNTLKALATTTPAPGFYYYTANFTSTAQGLGGAISFQLNTPIQTDYIYSLSVYVGFGTDSSNYPAPFWDSRIALGDTLSETSTNFMNHTNISDILYNTYSRGQSSYYFCDTENVCMNGYTGVLNYIFKANRSGIAMIVPFSTYQAYTGNFVYYGYNIEPLGNGEALTTEDLQSIINSSGLASAKSVEEVKNSVNEVKNEIEESTNKIDNTLNNDNVNENTGTDFFDNFDITDNGGISSIITSPLVAIEKMVSGTCSPLTTTYKGKTITLPCGNSFWADMPDVQNFLNIILGGFLCYGILAKLYLLIDRLKNPEDDRVEVMKL